MTNFLAKWKTLNILAQICLKIDSELEILKANVGMRISILELPYLPIFRQHRQLLLFWPKLAQKRILESEFQKSKSGSGINTPRYHLYHFLVKAENFEIFCLSLGKLTNDMQYFGSNKVEGVAENWVEVDGAGWT